MVQPFLWQRIGASGALAVQQRHSDTAHSSVSQQGAFQKENDMAMASGHAKRGGQRYFMSRPINVEGKQRVHVHVLLYAHSRL